MSTAAEMSWCFEPFPALCSSCSVLSTESSATAPTVVFIIVFQQLKCFKVPARRSGGACDTKHSSHTLIKTSPKNLGSSSRQSEVPGIKNDHCVPRLRRGPAEICVFSYTRDKIIFFSHLKEKKKL